MGKTEQIVGNAEAARLLKRDYRALQTSVESVEPNGGALWQTAPFVPRLGNRAPSHIGHPGRNRYFFLRGRLRGGGREFDLGREFPEFVVAVVDAVVAHDGDAEAGLGAAEGLPTGPLVMFSSRPSRPSALRW